jgi:23S rRNA pseudouridine1911/1915/1917 synthase
VVFPGGRRGPKIALVREAAIPILYEDEHLLAVDKPPGILVVGAPGRRGPTLLDRLAAQLGGSVLPVHRLDEETSGVLLVARTEAARAALEGLFRKHAVERVYRALVSRPPPRAAARIESRLREDAHGVVRSVTSGAGETAITEYRVLARNAQGTLLECRLHTGRRNQIRAHLSELGCPIVGDRKYGHRPRGARPGRLMLHSYGITLEHPLTGAVLAVVAEPDEPALRA